MGLFDSFFNSPQNSSMSPQQAVMNILVAAIMVDGEIEDDEVRQLRAMCLVSPLFSSNTADQDNLLIKNAVNNISLLREGAIRSSASALRDDLKETAFVLAVEMVVADGVVHAQEQAFIDLLARELNISEQLAHEVIKVSLIKMRN